MPATHSTCDFCDSHAEAIADGRVRVLPPVFKHYGRQQHFHGQVATVQCFEDNTLVRAALETAGMARVLVVDGGASLRHALLRHNVTFRLVLAFAAAGFVLILTSPPSGTSPGSRRRASRTSRWGR